YVGGWFSGAIDLDPAPGSVSRQEGSNGFLVKLNSAGSFLFGRALGGTNCSIGTLWSIALATDGTVWGTGTSSGECPIDPVDPNQDWTDETYVAAFSPNGGYLR